MASPVVQTKGRTETKRKNNKRKHGSGSVLNKAGVSGLLSGSLKLNTPQLLPEVGCGICLSELALLREHSSLVMTTSHLLIKIRCSMGNNYNFNQCELLNV